MVVQSLSCWHLPISSGSAGCYYLWLWPGKTGKPWLWHQTASGSSFLGADEGRACALWEWFKVFFMGFHHRHTPVMTISKGQRPLPSLAVTFCKFACVCAKLLQSCPTLCNPMDCSPPGSSVHGILQARVLEWVAMPFSRGSSWPGDQTWISMSPQLEEGFFITWKAHNRWGMVY